MLSRIKTLVKNSKLIYKIYSVCGSGLLQFAGLFVKTDPNLILFTSYGGRKYDDSPRVVYEYLRRNPVSKDHKYVWAFTEPEKYPEVPDKVRIDTPRFYLTALRAGYWMTNSSMTRGLDFKKKETRNIIFQHGMLALKRVGSDVRNADRAFVSTQKEKFDCAFIEGSQEIPILMRVWGQEEDVFYTTGLPRNDDLVGVTEEEIVQIKQRLGLPLDKKVILYSPTFRDASRDRSMELPMDLRKWERELGDEYVLLVTAHYEVAKLLDELPDNRFVYNAFGYPVLNDLMKAADVMISDYSSIIFDYAILERPIFCYGYDYEEYMKIRGSYVDIETVYCDGVLRTEEALLKAIAGMDYAAQCRYTREHIKEKYLAAYGDAARKAVEIIFGK